MNRPDNLHTTLSAAVQTLQQQGYSDELICTGQGSSFKMNALEAERCN